MARKQYHWLRFYDDFFQDKRIKKLRQISGGDKFVVIYMQMLMKAINTNGLLYYEGVAESFCEELALDLGEQPDNVRITLEFLLKTGLLECASDGRQYLLTEFIRDDRNLVGDGNDPTARQRKLRVKEDPFLLPKKEAKSNAERAANFKAKKACKQSGNVLMIPDIENRKKYGGNYYLCIKRDGFKCKRCGKQENLSVYILGNEICNTKNVTSNEMSNEKSNVFGNESNVTSNEKNVTSNEKSNEICMMITLCRDCYSDIGNEKCNASNVVESTYFTECSNVGNEKCNESNVPVSDASNEKCNENAIDRYRYKYINQSSSSACARVREVDKNILPWVLEQWNSLSDYGIKKLYTIWPYGTQAKEIISLIQEFGVDSFVTCIEKIKHSDYLQGKTKSRLYPIDFDWLIDPDNYQGIINGKYDKYAALPDKQKPVKVKNFIKMQQREENWPELEKKLLDN